MVLKDLLRLKGNVTQLGDVADKGSQMYRFMTDLPSTRPSLN
jgi:hypothetical protein